MASEHSSYYDLSRFVSYALLFRGFRTKRPADDEMEEGKVHGLSKGRKLDGELVFSDSLEARDMTGAGGGSELFAAGGYQVDIPSRRRYSI